MTFAKVTLILLSIIGTILSVVLLLIHEVHAAYGVSDFIILLCVIFFCTPWSPSRE